MAQLPVQVVQVANERAIREEERRMIRGYAHRVIEDNYPFELAMPRALQQQQWQQRQQRRCQTDAGTKKKKKKPGCARARITRVRGAFGVGTQVGERVGNATPFRTAIVL